MNGAFTYKLPAGIRPRPDLRKRRTAHKCRIAYATVKLIRSAHLHFLRQFYSCFAFHFEQHSYQVRHSALMEFRVNYSCLVFTYVIKGEWHVAMPDGQGSTRVVHKNECFAQSLPAGDYLWPLHAGKKQIVMLVLNPKWMLNNGKAYKRLVKPLKGIIAGTPTHQIFNSCLMIEEMLRHLRILQDYEFRDEAAIEKILLPIVGSLALDYHRLFSSPKSDAAFPEYKSDRQIALEARDKIIEEVETGNIPNIGNIASSFARSPTALRRACHKVFGMTTRELVMDAQMKIASSLIKKGLMITDIAKKLGYSEISSFSRSYKEYFGYSPSQQPSFDHDETGF